jgi:hypothetical protein
MSPVRHRASPAAATRGTHSIAHNYPAARYQRQKQRQGGLPAASVSTKYLLLAASFHSSARGVCPGQYCASWCNSSRPSRTKLQAWERKQSGWEKCHLHGVPACAG